MSLEEKFLAAVEVVNSIPADGSFEPSVDLLLNLYAYHMQATEGPCHTASPYPWNVTARAKWDSWNNLGNMSREVAMEKYIKELSKVIETMSYSDKVSKFMTLIGPFYESVPLDENKQPSKENTESCNQTTSVEEYKHPLFSQLYNLNENTRHITKQEESVDKHKLIRSSSSSSSISGISNFDLLSDLSGTESSDHDVVLVDYPAKDSPNDEISSKKKEDCPLGENLLLLAMGNLQSALEESLSKVDSLNAIAGEVAIEPESSGWSLDFPSAAFAFMWPVAVELFFQTFQE